MAGHQGWWSLVYVVLVLEALLSPPLPQPLWSFQLQMEVNNGMQGFLFARRVYKVM